MTTLTKAEANNPKTKVRKRNGAWCVLTFIEHNNHEVEYLVGTYDSWLVAFSVAQVEASPDHWPFYMEACS